MVRYKPLYLYFRQNQNKHVSLINRQIRQKCLLFLVFRSLKSTILCVPWVGYRSANTFFPSALGQQAGTRRGMVTSNHRQPPLFSLMLHVCHNLENVEINRHNHFPMGSLFWTWEAKVLYTPQKETKLLSHCGKDLSPSFSSQIPCSEGNGLFLPGPRTAIL